MSDSMQNALNEFLAETEELLEKITVNLTQIEDHESDEILNEIYRDLHTIKGSSQLFGCRQLGAVAHAMEASMDPVRNGVFKLRPALVDKLLAGLDIIKQIIEALNTSSDEPDLSAELNAFVPSLVNEVVYALGNGRIPLDDIVLPNYSSRAKQDLLGYKPALVEQAAPQEPTPVAMVQKETKLPESNLEKKTEAKEVVKNTSTEEKGLSMVSDQEVNAPVELVKKEDSAAWQSGEEKGGPKGQEAKSSETVRIQVHLLDTLMNLVGELVLIRNQVIQQTRNSEDSEFQNLSQRLNIVTGELQNGVMKTRMQPIGNVLTKFRRVVRDLSRDLGKQVDLQLVGAETELDKTLLEAIKDPLTHIVRNCVDHALETPQERLQSGKSSTGSVTICSYHEGGQVIVEIKDDGRGINPEKIGAKAVEKGVLTQDELSKMTDREVQALIFHPGFSTAEKVSKVSGRGVGMDVVKTNIEKIGGMVDLHSVVGEGTSVRFKIPLTLAIVPALIVKTLDERFAIPQVKLVELVRAERGKSGHFDGLEDLQGKLVYRLRGNLLPLVNFNDVLQKTVSEKMGDESTVSDIDKNLDCLNVIVLNADGMQFGLVVDEIEDSTDIVVKPLSNLLKNIGLYSGATVLGDGQVALTLDVIGLANEVGLFEEKQDASLGASISESSQNDLLEIILFDVGAPTPYALPLQMVSRLEEFQSKKIEVTGKQRVIQYRGDILPLINVAEFLGMPFEKQVEEDAMTNVIVVEYRGSRIGLEVNQILDVLTIEEAIDNSLSNRPEVLGNLLVNEKVIVVINSDMIVESFAAVKKSADTGRRNYKILLAEDNKFYRNHICQLLKDSGYNVIASEDGRQALDNLKSNEEFDVLLSDIEMPNMDGFELVENLRKLDHRKGMPAVAVTTRYTQEDQNRGINLGFNHYLKKLESEELLSVLDEVLGLKGA